MPTIQVSKTTFDALTALREETPTSSNRRYEPYNAVIERLLPEPKCDTV